LQRCYTANGDGGTQLNKFGRGSSACPCLIVVTAQFSASSLKNLVPLTVACAASPVSVIW